MAGKALLAFATGFGGGYLGAKRQAELDAREEEDRRMRQQEQQLRLDAARREEDLRRSLADATRPATVEEGAGGAIRPDTMDNRDVGQPGEQPVMLGNAFRVGGKAYGTRAEADTAAKDYSTPEQTDKRISLAYAQAGNPLAAKQYEGAARQAESGAMQLADQKWAQQIREAAQQGHAGLAQFVTNSQGSQLKGYRIQAVPTDDGKNVQYVKVGEDGTQTPIPNLKFSNDEEGAIRAAYMLDKSVKPETRYTHMLDEEKKKAAASAKIQELELKQRTLEEVQIPTMQIKAQLAEVKAALAEARAAGGSDKVGREERMRYTTLFTDAGRRMNDTQKSIRALQADPMFARRVREKPEGPEAQQLDGLKSDLASYKEERDLYQRLLGPGASKGDGEGAPGAKPAAAPKPAQGEPVRISTKAERDKLPKGARYIGPDGQQYVKQ